MADDRLIQAAWRALRTLEAIESESPRTKAMSRPGFTDLRDAVEAATGEPYVTRAKELEAERAALFAQLKDEANRPAV